MPKFKHIDISEQRLAQITEQYSTSRRRLLELLRYWSPRGGSSFNRNVPDFGTSEEGLFTGKWHRKLTEDDILFVCYVLRYQQLTGSAFTTYELEFIQGMENMVGLGKKRNNKQGWQLAMLLIEKVL